MSNDYDPDYVEKCRQAVMQYDMYRSEGTDPKWDPEQLRVFRSVWEHTPLPKTGQPLIFGFGRTKYEQSPYITGEIANKNVDTWDPSDWETNRAKKAFQRAKAFFGTEYFKYHKTLGFGGNGLALHYRYTGDKSPKDVVIKLTLDAEYSGDIREEEHHLRKVSKAAHCVQIIEPEAIGRPPQAKYLLYPPSFDSSDESESSGEESVDEEPPRKKPRRLLTAAEQGKKAARWNARRARWKEQQKGEDRGKDYLLLEYMEGGSIDGLIRRLIAVDRDRIQIIPNRVLWAIWLCLVRACVAMKYPPRKFHPGRHKGSAPSGSEDLIETIPPPHKRWRAKRMVHFDIDPSNIFIGDFELTGAGTLGMGALSVGDSGSKGSKQGQDKKLDDREEGEHVFFPRLKLADFGLAQTVKPHKRNRYYFWQRALGKAGFLTPEQFGSEWDYIEPDPNGPQVSEQDMAGNYGSATNVWGMGLLMWIIITQNDPPQPPQPQIPPGVVIPPNNNGNPRSIDQIIRATNPDMPISYCPLLMDGDSYGFVDEELRRTVYQCMYHRPSHRPTVEALLEQAVRGSKKAFPREGDDTVKEWVDRFILNAPLR
ncbi:kinase-like protein [Hypoxylon crocopeplum]|nr:kinase-like protein [Hypoxylon crocopeplum]